MNNKYNKKDIESILSRTASRLPGPRKAAPISPCMAGYRMQYPVRRRLRLHAPVWRTALIVFFLLCAGATTALAASPALREAVIRFFTHGTVEAPPIEQLSPAPSQGEESSSLTPASDTDPDKAGSQTQDNSQEPSASPETDSFLSQTAGSLTIVRPAALDSSFTAFYASSNDYLDLLQTPDGSFLLVTYPAGGDPVYYSLENGLLREIRLSSHSRTASVDLGMLPGVMSHDGDTLPWQVTLPTLSFTVVWQQYGDEILIGYSDSEERFDIGSTFGGLEGDYDGRFYFQAVPGHRNLVQVFFNFDGQLTEYHYPFLFNVATGEVSDPLAQVNLSAWPCITDLSISSDLCHATAMAGENHDSLVPIDIDLQTGAVAAPPVYEPPTEDCFVWFATGEHTLFYGMGDSFSLDGYLYDALTQTSTLLFSGAYRRSLADGSPDSPAYDFIGGGYAVFYNAGSVFLLRLSDGSFTRLEGVSDSENILFSLNDDHSLLNLSVLDENGNSTRLGFVVLETGEATFFDRNPPQGIREYASFWYSPRGFVMQVCDEETERNYLYLYEYTPEALR